MGKKLFDVMQYNDSYIEVDERYRKAIRMLLLLDLECVLEDKHPFTFTKKSDVDEHIVERNLNFIGILENYNKVHRFKLVSLIDFYIKQLYELMKEIDGIHDYRIFKEGYEEYHGIVTNFETLTTLEQELMIFSIITKDIMKCKDASEKVIGLKLLSDKMKESLKVLLPNLENKDIKFDKSELYSYYKFSLKVDILFEKYGGYYKVLNVISDKIRVPVSELEKKVSEIVKDHKGLIGNKTAIMMMVKENEYKI